jgi:MoaA/NifB/PqqE/SkfB family radical SAM enzyme
MSADFSEKPFDKDKVLNQMWDVRNKPAPVLKSFARADRLDQDLKVPGLPSGGLVKMQMLDNEGQVISATGRAAEESVWEARNNQRDNELRDSRRNVEINVGKACNNRCVFCMDGLPKKEDRSYMPIEDMKDEIERWSASGHQSLGFLGGEPTTYPWLPQAIKYASERGFTRIAIATNATKLRFEHYTDKLLDAGLTRVTISMHGHTGPLEDKLTRVPKVYGKKVKAMRYLVAKKREGYLVDGLSVNIVLNGWNYKYLPKMLKFFYLDIGIDDVRVNFMRPEGYAEGNRELCASLTDVVPFLMKSILLNEYHFHKTFTFGGFPLCTLPKQLRNSDVLLKKYMGEYRDLSTDCSVKQDTAGYGIEEFDNQTQRARFNWQERKRFDLKTPVAACLKCSKRDLCEGIWNGYRFLHGDDEFHTI